MLICAIGDTGKSKKLSFSFSFYVNLLTLQFKIWNYWCSNI